MDILNGHFYFLIPRLLYPCKGYINFGQKYATHYRRILRLYKVCIYDTNAESASSKESYNPCLSVRMSVNTCPSIATHIGLLAQELS